MADGITKQELIEILQEQLGALEKRFDAKLDKRFSEQEKRFDAKLDVRFGEQNVYFRRLLQQELKKLADKIDALDKRTDEDTVESIKEVEKLKKRMKTVEVRLAELEATH